MRVDHLIKLYRAAEIGLPLSVVYIMGGLIMGLCSTAIVAGMLLLEYQTRPRKELVTLTTDEGTFEVTREVLNPKGPHFF